MGERLIGFTVLGDFRPPWKEIHCGVVPPLVALPTTEDQEAERVD